MSTKMSPKLFINMFTLIFQFYLGKPSGASHSHIPYVHSAPTHSPISNVHKQIPFNFLKNLLGTQKGYEAKGVLELKNYLSKLGYMKGEKNSNVFDDNLELALKKYQLFFNLQPSGILDNETIQTLLQPRCGVQDIHLDESEFDNNSPLMVSHYAFLPGNPKWPSTKKILTYSFQPGTRADAMQPIVWATTRWANVTHFEFNYIENYETADIKISFQQGDHGDGSPFDGPGGVIAHSGWPPLDAVLHYDASEMWVDGVVTGYLDMRSVGLHELGHILGLNHSNDTNAAMYPHIGPNVRRDLSQDDINGVRAIYQEY